MRDGYERLTPIIYHYCRHHLSNESIINIKWHGVLYIMTDITMMMMIIIMIYLYSNRIYNNRKYESDKSVFVD